VCDLGADPAVAANLGIVAGALEQPVGDPRRAAAAAGDRDRSPLVELDGEDPRGAGDDRGELFVRVGLEPGLDTKAVSSAVRSEWSRRPS